MLASVHAIVSLHDRQCSDQACSTRQSGVASGVPRLELVLHTRAPATSPRFGSPPGSSQDCWEARETEK